MADQDFMTRLSRMSKAELEEHMIVAKITEKAAAIVGIGSVVLACAMPSIFTGFIAGIALYFFGNLAVGADNAIAYIKHLMETKFKDK